MKLNKNGMNNLMVIIACIIIVVMILGGTAALYFKMYGPVCDFPWRAADNIL